MLNSHAKLAEKIMAVTFAQRDIESIVLKPGFIAGCGLFLKETSSAHYRLGVSI